VTAAPGRAAGGWGVEARPPGWARWPRGGGLSLCRSRCRAAAAVLCATPYLDDFLPASVGPGAWGQPARVRPRDAIAGRDCREWGLDPVQSLGPTQAKPRLVPQDPTPPPLTGKTSGQGRAGGSRGRGVARDGGGCSTGLPRPRRGGLGVAAGEVGGGRRPRTRLRCRSRQSCSRAEPLEDSGRPHRGRMGPALSCKTRVRIIISSLV
jgi:hypothetical protein